ncbi:hypothetical protein ACFQ9X_31275 [Catenulispora yoronensis]
MGRHGQSYDYHCPHQCGSVVRPHVRPAAESFDLTDLGTRLADKDGPRRTSTTARLEAALRYLTSDATRRHGPRSLRPHGARRLAVMEYRNNCSAASGWEPITTVAAGATTTRSWPPPTASELSWRFGCSSGRWRR